MDIEGLLYKLKINIVTNLNIKEADRLELGNDIFEIESLVKSTIELSEEQMSYKFIQSQRWHVKKTKLRKV
tara:strand:+ start:526 stop:738 length:213 start_codon:yes stop_codon:yes gene_type:complete